MNEFKYISPTKVIHFASAHIHTLCSSKKRSPLNAINARARSVNLSLSLSPFSRRLITFHSRRSKVRLTRGNASLRLPKQSPITSPLFIHAYTLTCMQPSPFKPGRILAHTCAHIYTHNACLRSRLPTDFSREVSGEMGILHGGFASACTHTYIHAARVL